MANGIEGCRNTANPYDGDPGIPASPLHGVIQVIEVPLNNLAASREIAQPRIVYTGGVEVIDFTKPARLREVAFYDPQQDSGTWSAYPYTGPMFKHGPGAPVYASDGVESNAIAEGMVVYRTKIQRPGRSKRVDQLNPQTLEE